MVQQHPIVRPLQEHWARKARRHENNACTLASKDVEWGHADFQRLPERGESHARMARGLGGNSCRL